MENATTMTHKQSDYKFLQSSFTLCFDSKLVGVLVVIGLMETRLNDFCLSAGKLNIRGVLFQIRTLLLHFEISAALDRKSLK